MPARRLPPDPGLGPVAALRAYRADPIGMLRETFRRCGDIATFRLGPQRIYAVNHPDLASEVLVGRAGSFHKGRIVQASRALLGDGLLTSEDDVHARHRRLIQPSFAQRHVDAHAPTVAMLAARHADGWQDGARVDMADEMTWLTLAVVGATLFGGDLADDELRGVADALRDAVTVFEIVALPFGEQLLRSPLPSARRFRRGRARVYTTVERLIAARRRDGAARDDLLSLLVAARDDGSGRLTDAELRDEAVTMLLAGHETTSNALTWTWLLLAQHPDAGDALAAEAEAVLDGRPPGADAVERLPWCGQVLDEALRLYPPGWVLPRLAVEPVELGGWVVPAGAVVIVCAPLLHRDARFWDDPERFDPARFAPDAARDRPRHAYIPFAAGPRSCIGRGFARMEATIILATLVRRFRADLVPGASTVPATRFTLRPRHGLPMTLARR